MPKKFLLFGGGGGWVFLEGGGGSATFIFMGVGIFRQKHFQLNDFFFGLTVMICTSFPSKQAILVYAKSCFGLLRHSF